MRARSPAVPRIHQSLELNALPPEDGVPAVEPTIVIVVAEETVFPFQCAWTSSRTTPAPLPAVRTVVLPTSVESEPRVSFVDQANTIPEGQVPPPHTGTAVKRWTCPEDSDTFAGVTETDSRATREEFAWIVTESLAVRTVPPRVAVTVTVSIPALPPALKVAAAPLEVFNVPNAGSERAQARESEGRQVPT